MQDDPEKPLTLGLACDRFLDSLSNSPDDDEDIDPEDAAEDLAYQQEEITKGQKQAQVNLALGLTDDEREDLWATFRDHQWIINVCNTILAAVLIYLAHAALVTISQRLAGPASSSTILLFPDPIIWWLWPFFAGICFAWEATIILWAMFVNARMARLYRIWAQGPTFQYESSEFNAMNFNRWFILLAVLPGGLATALALNMHATVGPTSITDCGYAAKTCQVYAYADIKTIAYIPAHKLTDSRTPSKLVLEFNSGAKWSSSEWGDENDDVDPALVNFLAARVPLPVTGIDAFRNHSPSINQPATR
jgi:hypothetical protein